MSYVTQLFQYGTGLFVLPVILRYLSSSELAIWYIFLSISSFVALFDLGFSQNISRNISYVFNGSQTLLKEGYVVSDDTDINYNLLFSLINTSRKIYRKISIIALLLLSTIGSLYLYFVLKKNSSEIDYVYIAWIVFIISTVFNFYYTYLPLLVRGSGMITEYNYIIIASRIIYIIALFILIFFNCGLLSLAIANFVSALVNRLMGNYYFFGIKMRGHKYKNEKYNDSINLFPVLWHNSKKIATVSFCVFVFTQMSVLFSGWFLSANDVAQLGLVLQIFTILQTLARVNFNTYYPQFSALWIEQGIADIKKRFTSSMIIGYVIFFVGLLFICFAGNSTLELIKSKTLLPSMTILLLYGLFYLMEITHGNCAMLIATRNEIPFMKSSIYSSIAAIILIFLFIELNLGIMSFPLALVITSLSYNGWKWPYEVYKLLQPFRL
jgi:O-antigen/teichoic acid export membrane protein